MKIHVIRDKVTDKYSFGTLYVNDKLFCNTIEDTDRGITKDTPLSEIKKIKVKDETAIPTGIYELTLKVISPKYSKVAFYKEVCNGYLPRILDVPGFDGILIHSGNLASDSSGCVICGVDNGTQSGVIKSKDTFKDLYKVLKAASDKGEKIEIEIIKI